MLDPLIDYTLNLPNKEGLAVSVVSIIGLLAINDLAGYMTYRQLIGDLKKAQERSAPDEEARAYREIEPYLRNNGFTFWTSRTPLTNNARKKLVDYVAAEQKMPKYPV